MTITPKDQTTIEYLETIKKANYYRGLTVKNLFKELNEEDLWVETKTEEREIGGETREIQIYKYVETSKWSDFGIEVWFNMDPNDQEMEEYGYFIISVGYLKDNNRNGKGIEFI